MFFEPISNEIWLARLIRLAQLGEHLIYPRNERLRNIVAYGEIKGLLEWTDDRWQLTEDGRKETGVQ